MLLSFLDEIRNIAVNKKNLSAVTIARMKRAPILLCSQRKVMEKSTHKTIGDESDDGEWEIGYDLKTAEQIVVADSTTTHQVFGAELFTAPQEDIIEGELLLIQSILHTGDVRKSILHGLGVSQA